MTDTIDGLDWYHTFDLGSAGVTKGLFDHRKVVEKLPIPKDLTGMRCIDLAASDGFFGIEMAKRGAAEVISLDLTDKTGELTQSPGGVKTKDVVKQDRPTRCFELVKKTLGLTNIERVDMSLFDMTPDNLGTFDFAFMGNVLLHLSDPVRATNAVAGITKPGARFLSFEQVSLALSLLTRRPVGAFFVATDSGTGPRDDLRRFWTPNAAAHRGIVRGGGFEIVDKSHLLFQPVGSWRQRWPRSVPRNVRQLQYWLIVRRLGLPSAWVLAEKPQT